MFVNNIINKPFALLIAALILTLIAAPLFQQGLFIDGLLYKTVSVNYFSGESSFWRMKFSDTSMTQFYEQPPLFFFVTGFYYKIFGSSFLADKFLTLFFFLFSVWLLYKICGKILGEPGIFLFVLFLLLCIPVLSWTWVNQVIETLVLPLGLLAFLVFLNFSGSARPAVSGSIHLAAFIGVVFLLFLTKGFQSCFIIVLPFFHAVFFREKKSLVFALLSVAGLISLLFFVTRVHDPSAEWFSNYFEKRLLASLNNVGATTGNRAEIIIRLITELLMPFILVIMPFIFFRSQKHNGIKRRSELKMAWVLLATALFGSLPFAITLEQRGFYLAPSFPFFILSFGLFFKSYLLYAFEKFSAFLKRGYVSVAVLVFFLVSLGYWIISPVLYKRDENLINDLKLIGHFVDKGDTLSIDESMWNDYPLQAYLYMQFKVNVEGNYKHRFYIHDREHPGEADESYSPINIPTRQYDLFLKK